MEPRSHLVFSRDIKQVVKKKFIASTKDKKDWSEFTKNLKNIKPKDIDFFEKNNPKKAKKLDLHGFSLEAASQKVKQFLIENYEKGFKKVIIVTGKGLRSKTANNPYISEKLNVLKYSIPEFIKNDELLKEKVNKISTASLEDGGEGAIYVFLKKKVL